MIKKVYGYGSVITIGTWNEETLEFVPDNDRTILELAQQYLDAFPGPLIINVSKIEIEPGFFNTYRSFGYPTNRTIYKSDKNGMPIL